jgi:hypothetical protein
MLRDGELLGAFTTGSRELQADEREILGLGSDPDAKIEVRSASGEAVEPRRYEPEEVEPISQMLA